MKLSDYVVSFFEKNKVKNMFMVTGGSCMHLMNSFGNSNKIKYWCTEHEQAAAMAAEAYSKMENDLGLVLTTSGPGATNTITGVLDCYLDSTPVVFLSGQSKSKQTIIQSGIDGLRQFGVQEANIIPIVESITKFAVEIDDPKKIRYYLEKAVHMAKNGRPGPVWISIPLDIQSAGIDEKSLEGFDNEDETGYLPSDEDIEYCCKRILEAKRPVIIGGHGIRISGACDRFGKFVEKHKIPVVTPIMGIDVLEGDHICNIGRTGTKGTRAGNFAMQNSDLIISIGSRLPISVIGHEYDKFAREADVIIVDIDKIEHQKRTINNIDKIINCDANEFLSGISNTLKEGVVFDEWLEKCQSWKKRYPVILPQYDDDADGINYYKLIDIINQNMESDMTVVSDAGSAFYVVSQAIDLKKNQRYITTGGTATMGFTVPASIGTAVATPNGKVIGITGEGSFMQNLQELEVIKYHSFPIKLFVVNNGGYFSIHQTQKRYFDGNFVGAGVESGISFSDIGKISEAFGIKHYKYDKVEHLEQEIKRILESDEPIIIEVVATENMEIIPTASSKMKPNGIMVSKPLEDMYPFLDREEFFEQMIVEPLVED